MPCGIFDFGTRTGLVLEGVLVPWLVDHYGWRTTFAVVGFTALLWLVPWLAITPRRLQGPSNQVTGLSGLSLVKGFAALAAHNPKFVSAVVGCLLGGFLGFFLRPAAGINGQLSFLTVISRGADLSDAVLISTARASFNYLVGGVSIGAMSGLVGASALLARLSRKAPDRAALREARTRYRDLFGLCLGFFCFDYYWYLLVTWLPDYLVNARHLSLQKAGIYASLPFLVFGACQPLGGWVADRLTRAGWDATISAPKSVSLAALVGNDERIRVAHRESVNEALKSFEEYLQARGGGNKPAITTGKMVAAQFEHTASRPDHKTGYAAPQLHTHAVIFNMTKTPDGKIRSVQPLELYRSQQYATAIYRMTLAEKLQGLGYEIEIDTRTGAPEIKGFSKEYLRDSSPRREEVLKEAQEMKERLQSQGINVKDGPGLNQAAARADRAAKHYDPDEMRERALEMDARYDNQAERSVERALENGSLTRSATRCVR